MDTASDNFTWKMDKVEMEQNIITICKMGQVNKQPMKAGMFQ